MKKEIEKKAEIYKDYFENINIDFKDFQEKIIKMSNSQ